MKRFFIISVLSVMSLMFGLSMSSKVNIGSDSEELNAYKAFMNLPDDILPVIDKSARFDMLEYFLVDSVYKATNRLNETSYIDSLTNDCIEVAVSKASRMSLKVLSGKKNEKIIAVIYTFYGPAADSKLYFLDESFNVLDTERYFKEPKLKDFFSIPKGSITKTGELVDMITYPTIEYRFVPGKNDLSLSLTVGEHINQDDYNIMKLFLLPEITFEWQNGRYKQMKNKK